MRRCFWHLGLSKEGFRLNDDDLNKLKEKKERALVMDGTSSSEAEEEVSIATMLGLDADASDSDGEHMVFDPAYLRDASDFVSVDVKVVEYKGRTLFHTKAFLIDTTDCLKENILVIIHARTPATHFHRRITMDGFDLLYDDKAMDESLTLHDYFDEGVNVHTVALHLKIKGGGLSRGVSKHVVKSKGEKRVLAEDANGFQTTFNTCVQTFGSGNFSVNLAIDAMAVPELEELKVHLASGGKKPNSAKLAELPEFFVQYKTMKQTSEQIVCSMSKFVELVDADLKASFGKGGGSGGIDIEALREKVMTTLVIKKDRIAQSQSHATAGGDVAM